MRQLEQNRKRYSMWAWMTCLMMCLTSGAVYLAAPTVAYAQPAEPEAVEAPEAPEAPDAPDAPEAPDADDAEATPESKSLLTWIYEALGIMYLIVFLSLSFTLVALLVMNILSATRGAVCPQDLEMTFSDMLDNQQYQEAYELAKVDSTMLGQMLSAGLGKLSNGYPQAIEAMQEVGEVETMKQEHRLSYMALIGTISPMVGLFGTVHGMINSFEEIALGGSTPSPTKLAEGISTALFTTLVGLAIAIPAIACFNILKNQVSRLVLEVGIVSEGLMSRFENVGK